MLWLYSSLSGSLGILRQGLPVQVDARRLGAQLRRIRRQRGMTQEELAERSGYHPTHIANIERGRNLPSLDAIFRLAQALGVSAADLVRAAETAAPKDAEALRTEAHQLLQRCDTEQLAVLVRLLRWLTRAGGRAVEPPMGRAGP